MATIKKTITGLKPATNYLFSLKPKNTEISAIDAIPDTIRVQTPSVVSTPSSITGLLLAANFKSAMLSFNHASMVDLDYYEYKIYLADDVTETALKAKASTIDGAMVSGITKSNLVVISDLDNTTLTGASPTPVAYKAKVRAVNTAGNAGAFSSASALATTQLIEGQFIEDLTAGKIKAGTIGAHEIILTQPGAAQTSYTPPGSTAVLRSSNYLAGSGGAGWLIRGDGFAEFDATNIRGSLTASSISLNDHNYWLPNSANPIFKVGNNDKNFQWNGADLTTTGNLITNATVTGGTVGGITVGSGVTVNRFYIGTGEFNNANTAFFVDSAGKFSLKDKFVWTGSALTIAGDVTIGATAASTVVSNAATGATAVQPANVQNNIGGTGITTITGGKVRTGLIDSTNLSWDGATTYTLAGTRIDLDNGQIVSKTFRIDTAGNATFGGAVTGATITGSTVTGSTIQNAASSPLFKVDTSGNVFANNIYATGTDGVDGGLVIRSDATVSGAGAPASNGSMSIYSAIGTSTVDSSTSKLRLGSKTRYLEISYPISGSLQHVNVETNHGTGASAQHLRLNAETGQIGLLGNVQTQRTQDAVTVGGDIVLENYGPAAVAGGNSEGTRTVFSKNIGASSSGVNCQIGVLNGLEFYGSPGSLRELKENIQDISGIEAINIVKSLRPRKFTWKPTSEDTELGVALKNLDLHYGFIAEEIQETQPQLATYKMTPAFQNSWPNVTDEMFNDFSLIFYKDAELPSIAISAIKNLIERIESLEAQLAAQ